MPDLFKEDQIDHCGKGECVGDEVRFGGQIRKHLETLWLLCVGE